MRRNFLKVIFFLFLGTGYAFSQGEEDVRKAVTVSKEPEARTDIKTRLIEKLREAADRVSDNPPEILKTLGQQRILIEILRDEADHSEKSTLQDRGPGRMTEPRNQKYEGYLAKSNNQLIFKLAEKETGVLGALKEASNYPLDSIVASLFELEYTKAFKEAVNERAIELGQKLVEKKPSEEAD